jgi:RimJ/RimL family protein N-acetyltransferase
MSQNALYMRPIEDEDIPEILTWFDGEIGALANGVGERMTADALRPDPAHGTDLLVGIVPEEGIVGVFNWVESRGTGSFFVGIVTRPERVGTGYGAMVLEQGIGFLFDQRRAHRIELRAATYNRHVMAMMRAGYMTLEGLLRDNIFIDGRYESTVIASMLESEYRELLRTRRMLPAHQNFSEEDQNRARKALRNVVASERVNKSWEDLLQAVA